MIEEEFRSVKGYEGLYEVSNLGRVRSLNYMHTGKTRVLKPKVDRYGYYIVGLHKGGKRKLCKIHRLVAMAFIPNPDGLPCVNHINEDKQSNVATNLEWCDVAYNNAYGTHNERSAKARINHPNRSKPVYQYTLDGSFVAEYPSINEAYRQTGIWFTHISHCCLGKPHYNSAGNYRWSFDPPTSTTNRALF